MKRWSAALLAPLLLAAAPTPLVTGAVRDQYGEPIAGALVSAAGSATVTDAAGTFALEGAAGSVTIRCAYCETTRAAVGADHTVTVIVLRYDSLAQEAPSPRDLAAIPYSNIESSISLRPYTLLEDSARTLPGPRISTYGTSAAGGLLVDNGIPDYDIAAGVTTWRTIPAFYAQNVLVRDQTQAFRYGDMAGGGTFFVNTLPQARAVAVAGAGTQGELAISGSNGAGSYGVGLANDGTEARERLDGALRVPVGDDTLSANAIVAQDNLTPDYAGSVNNDSQELRLHYDRVRENALYADFVADRSGYESLSPAGSQVTGEWSDIGFQTGVTWRGPLNFFTDFGVRGSTAYYNASVLGIPRVAGTVTQAHVSAGAAWQSSRASVVAGLGAFDIAYGGGTLGVSQPFSAQILTPSLRASYAFTSNWSAEISGSDAFRLPTLLEAYTYPKENDTLPFDFYQSVTESVTYTDLHRFRASLVAMNERVSQLDDGMVHSAGASLGWQIAPLLSLRAWAMHVADNTLPEEPVARFGRSPMPATVYSYWMTYDNPAGIRLDAIYRSDLIDYRPDPHLDASVSGPLTSTIRWFAATERRHDERYTSAGIRVLVP